MDFNQAKDQLKMLAQLPAKEQIKRAEEVEYVLDIFWGSAPKKKDFVEATKGLHITPGVLFVMGSRR